MNKPTCTRAHTPERHLKFVLIQLRDPESRRDKGGEKGGKKGRQAFLLQSSSCHFSETAAKPIILSSSFFSGAAEASLDCRVYKGSPSEAIHGAE